MILLKNLFVGGLHLLMEIRKFDVTLKNWIIMNGLIKILYKTLTGEYATRWARENELSRLKGVKPLDTERFGLVYPEPDEEWPVGENKRDSYLYLRNGFRFNRPSTNVGESGL